MSRWLQRSLLALLASTSAVVEASELVRFVGCPIYRDTQAGRKSGCWLADQPTTGVRYDITQSPTKPDWNFAVLVEGLRDDSDSANPCGGVVLNPVRVSILPTGCPAHRLPAEGFAGRPYTLPARNVRPSYEARVLPEQPYQQTTFTLLFDYQKDFFIYQFDDYFLDNAITWIRAVDPSRIEVVGYAATKAEVVDGVTLKEPASLAHKRADKVKEALIRLGVDPSRLRVKTSSNPKPVDAEGVDGLTTTSLRRVDIIAIP